MLISRQILKECMEKNNVDKNLKYTVIRYFNRLPILAVKVSYKNRYKMYSKEYLYDSKDIINTLPKIMCKAEIGYVIKNIILDCIKSLENSIED